MKNVDLEMLNEKMEEKYGETLMRRKKTGIVAENERNKFFIEDQVDQGLKKEFYKLPNPATII